MGDRTERRVQGKTEERYLEDKMKEKWDSCTCQGELGERKEDEKE